MHAALAQGGLRSVKKMFKGPSTPAHAVIVSCVLIHGFMCVQHLS